MRLRFAKNKKLMITAIILSTLFILGAVSVLFLNQAKFGRIPQGKRLERIKQSPHYDGQKFVNDEKTVTMTGDKNLFETTLEFLFGKRSQTVPDTALTVVKTDLKSLPQDRDWLVWFGHSSYLMNLSGKKILVDPVFYQGSPVSFVNKMFKGTDVYKPADMPAFYAALIFFIAAEIAILAFALRRWKQGREKVEQAWQEQPPEEPAEDTEDAL